MHSLDIGWHSCCTSNQHPRVNAESQCKLVPGERCFTSGWRQVWGWSMDLCQVSFLLSKTSHTYLKKHPFLQYYQTKPPVTGKILEILQDVSGVMSFIVINLFQVSALQHEYFWMPVLSQWLDETMLLIVPVKVSTFTLSFLGAGNHHLLSFHFI